MVSAFDIHRVNAIVVDLATAFELTATDLPATDLPHTVIAGQFNAACSAASGWTFGCS